MIVVTDPTIDDKIELLVRSVLEAVDVRLGEIRHDMQALATDVRRQHETVAERLSALEQRTGTSDGAQQLERIEEMHRRHATEIDERFAEVNSAIDRLSGATVRALTPADTGPIPMLVDLDSVSAPLLLPPITGQHPVMLQEPPSITTLDDFRTSVDDDATTEHPTTGGPTADDATAFDVAAELPPPIAFDGLSTDDADREPIDLTQLADLLSERLGQLSLPPTPH